MYWKKYRVVPAYTGDISCILAKISVLVGTIKKKKLKNWKTILKNMLFKLIYWLVY